MKRPEQTNAARRATGRWQFVAESPAETKRPHYLDQHVGSRIRERRIVLGLTQQELADLIDVTFQQTHKYERGSNRVSAGRLFEIAQVLSVPVSYFFDDLDERSEGSIGAPSRHVAPLGRSTSRAQDVDRHVGARIRQRRIMLGLTQQELAELIGVSYQQVQKYERGSNRVSAGRLFEIAQVLSVPASYFFDDLDERNEGLIGPPEAEIAGAAMRSAFGRATKAAVSKAHEAGLAVPGRRGNRAVEIIPDGREQAIDERRVWSPIDWRTGRHG